MARPTTSHIMSVLCLLLNPAMWRDNRYVILLLTLGLIPDATRCQVANSNFEHFTVRDGLPSQQIYNCYQDLQGFLWIATDAGVSRFDGRTFKNFNISDGLGDNEILEICGDTHGRVWFTPFNGHPSYYYNGKIYTINIDTLFKKPSRHISNHLIIGEDAFGNIYLAKPSSASVIKLPYAGKPVAYDLSLMLEAGEYIQVYYSPLKSQVYCITTKARLILLEGTVAKDVTPPGFLKKEKPFKFYINHSFYNGYALFLGDKGIYKLSGAGARLLLPNEKLPKIKAEEFIHAQLDPFNNLWLNHPSYNTLFFQYDNGNYLDQLTVLNNSFASVCLDKENNIWFTTTNGLYKTTFAKLQNQQTYIINSNLLVQNVTSCAIDKDSGLWLGYNNGFVTRIKNGTARHYNLRIGQKTINRVLQIKTNPQGSLLFATDETFTSIKRLKAETYDQPLHYTYHTGRPVLMSIKNIFFNNQDSAFLIQPIANCIFKIDLYSGRLIERYKNIGYINSRIFYSFFDRQNRLYTSTVDGFTMLENNHLNDLAKNDQRLKARIQGFAESRDGTIFLASYNYGLLAMKDAKIISHMPRFNNQSVISRRVYIRNDTIYVATNQGIGVLTYNGSRFNLIHIFSTSDGLISNDVSDLTFLNDQMYVTTSQGVSILKIPYKPAVQAARPTLVLQELKADDSLYSLSKGLELPHKTRLIRITFIAPVLDRPELTLYRYRLNSSDSWQTTSANFIEFSKLKPGQYAIEIQAKKYNSDWSAPGVFVITIRPPFYNTLWFICLAIICLAACIYLIVRTNLQRKYREQLIALQKKEAIEKERNRIAADIHDDIGAELTNIAILSQILRNDARTGIDDTLTTVQKIEAAAKQVIIKIDEVIWTLSARNYSLKRLMIFIRNYLTSLSENSSAVLNVTIADSSMVDEPLAGEFTRNVFLVIKELLQNALKHSQATTVSIHISLSQHRILCIQYNDDGVGFNLGEATEGNGLRNIKRRVIQSNGTLDIRAEKNRGCQVKIELPINQLNYE